MFKVGPNVIKIPDYIRVIVDDVDKLKDTVYFKLHKEYLSTINLINRVLLTTENELSIK